MYVHMYVRIYLSMYVYICTYVCIRMYICTKVMYICIMYECMYVCMHASSTVMLHWLLVILEYHDNIGSSEGDARALAHTCAASHNPNPVAAERDAFLPSAVVGEGQRTHTTNLLVRFCSLAMRYS